MKAKSGKSTFRQWFRIIWLSLVVLFMIWQWNSYQAKDMDPSMLTSSSAMSVEEGEDMISFIPSDSKMTVIFFPGGLVDPEAYVPLCRTIAAKGYNTHIIKMPWRLSTQGYERIDQLFDMNQQETLFALGGHSQGGKMAAQFVHENPVKIDALFLLGTSHPRDYDLSNADIPTIKVFAEHDGLASVQEVEGNAHLLPHGTQLVQISGGNHSQFGFMGRLLMDSKATISREQQLKETCDHLVKFLDHIY